MSQSIDAMLFSIYAVSLLMWAHSYSWAFEKYEAITHCMRYKSHTRLLHHIYHYLKINCGVSLLPEHRRWQYLLPCCGHILSTLLTAGRETRHGSLLDGQCVSFWCPLVWFWHFKGCAVTYIALCLTDGVYDLDLDFWWEKEIADGGLPFPDTGCPAPDVYICHVVRND